MDRKNLNLKNAESPPQPNIDLLERGKKALQSVKLHEQKEITKISVGAANISKGELIGDNSILSEDAHYVNAEKGVFAVFDGTGGDKGSREASRLAKETLAENVEHSTVNRANLTRLLQNINTEILYEKKILNKKIGTTTAALAKIDHEDNGDIILSIASIGDSRIYVLRKNRLTLLTRDDNVTENMLGDAYLDNPTKRKQLLEHGISKYLGRLPSKDVKCSPGNNENYVLQSGDKILLCTDGITGDTEKDRLPDSKIQSILSQNMSNEDIANELVDAALKIDDRTAVVVSI